MPRATRHGHTTSAEQRAAAPERCPLFYASTPSATQLSSAPRASPRVPPRRRGSPPAWTAAPPHAPAPTFENIARRQEQRRPRAMRRCGRGRDGDSACWRSVPQTQRPPAAAAPRPPCCTRAASPRPPRASPPPVTVTSRARCSDATHAARFGPGATFASVACAVASARAAATSDAASCRFTSASTLTCNDIRRMMHGCDAAALRFECVTCLGGGHALGEVGGEAIHLGLRATRRDGRDVACG